jgi:putative phosphoesterase
MRIGVVSDTHDRHDAIAEAVRRLQEQRVELILHCGDIESVEAVHGFHSLPTYFVFGNWDRERKQLAAAIKAIGGVYFETFGVLEAAGKRIAWLHSHERRYLRQLENADYFDFLFYGHTHLREQHRTGRTVVANPGALFRANPRTCIVVDLCSGEIKPLIISTGTREIAEPTDASAASNSDSWPAIGSPGITVSAPPTSASDVTPSSSSGMPPAGGSA